MSTLYHYTCDHGRAGIGLSGYVKPGPLALAATSNPAGLRLSWFTDLATPQREALGLTSNYIQCDRTRWCYVVAEGAQIVPWVTIRRDINREWRDELESSPGARPRHWYVASEPVAVELVVTQWDRAEP